MKSAIGFNETRGDKVDVVNMRFATADEGVDGPSASLLWGLPIDKTDLMRMGQSLLVALVVVLGLLFVLRPMALKIGRPVPGGDVAMLPAAGEAATADERPAALAAGERMVEVEGFEGSLRASSILRVADLVQKQPEASVAVMRNWLAEDAA